MFRRVTPEDWSQITAIVGFSITFIVFSVALYRSWRISRRSADRSAHLPLETDSPLNHHTHE